MASMIRVGVVGAGAVAQGSHIPAVRECGGEVAALVDVDLEKAKQVAKREGIPAVFASHREMLAEVAVDLVSICTDSRSHLPIALDALEAGKALYIEKPPTENATQIQQVAELAEAKGQLVYAGSHHPCRPNVRHLRDSIESGRLGEVYAIDAVKLRRDQPPGFRPDFPPRSVVTESLSHRIDIALYLLGTTEVSHVTAKLFDHFSRRYARHAGRPLEDTVVANLATPGGCVITLRDLSHAHYPQPDNDYWYFGEFDVFGTKGGARLHPLTYYHGEPGEELQEDQPEVDNRLSRSHGGVYRCLFDCLAEGRRPDRSPQRAVTVMRVIDAIFRSARDDGRQQRLDKG